MLCPSMMRSIHLHMYIAFDASWLTMHWQEGRGRVEVWILARQNSDKMGIQSTDTRILLHLFAVSESSKAVKARRRLWNGGGGGGLREAHLHDPGYALGALSFVFI